MYCICVLYFLKRRHKLCKNVGVDFKRTDQLFHCFLWQTAQRRSGCFISFPVFRGQNKSCDWASTQIQYTDSTNTTQMKNKYWFAEKRIQHVYNVYFISYPAFWTEDREQIPRLGGMARFSLAPYFPSLSQHTNTIQTQNQYSTQTEQIRYKQRTNTVIASYGKIFISPNTSADWASIQMH